ncbi:endonuclease/exonuclease/phosphatase [Pseudomonas sp. M47T1]|uniref:endonuclease/exonuclease/phosphatase family protein n=1 Tax=Pseudomonas sp. M47T1 TaxID=1179778 RepID=UPI0002608391|nr:endonuclease/exonuclease/phosphatase family protein [Pseudomonas sp. M47T1]EIK93613.1 endonuclease/exonuclease/phosphatase [Pseudomonas sp. M47T1]
MTRLQRNTLLVLVALALLLALLVYTLTWHPLPREKLGQLCRGAAPQLVPGQALKVMTWNVQHLAGKQYVFWYDVPDGSGPDDRASAEDLAYNLDEVTRVIRDEQPDLLLFQELDDGAKASDYQDQLSLLRARIVDLYPCSVDAFDWKADFIPNPHILGSVGRKLATLSRFQIVQAERQQLPQPEGHWLTAPFRPHRALLTSYLPIQGGGQLAVLNTHLDDYVPGEDTQVRQMQAILKRVDRMESHGTPWLLGGDFNALPLGQAVRLAASQRPAYPADSSLHLLWDRYPMIPDNREASGEDRSDWFTHYPNDPAIPAPDRTLDYLFHSPKLKRIEARVRQDDTEEISDHMPLTARLMLPPPSR